MLSPADWAQVVTLYSRGEKTVRDLADQFGVSPQAIHKGLRQRGITKGSRIADVEGEIEDEAEKARREKVKAAIAKADQFGKFNEFFVQILVKRIRDANENGSLAAANGDVITIKNAMATLAKGRSEAWDIHKIEEMLQESEELATLNVGEYTEDELETIRAANEEAYQASMEDIDNLVLDEDEGDEEDGELAD
jgi:DNA-binding transcriptional regulator YhcF (GntR family)